MIEILVAKRTECNEIPEKCLSELNKACHLSRSVLLKSFPLVCVEKKAWIKIVLWGWVARRTHISVLKIKPNQQLSELQTCYRS